MLEININGQSYAVEIMEEKKFYKHVYSGNYFKILELERNVFGMPGLSVVFECVNSHFDTFEFSKMYPQFQEVYFKEGTFVEIAKEEYYAAMGKGQV